MPPISANPWMNLDDLGQIIDQGDPSKRMASFDDPAGIQQFLNMQNSAAPDQYAATAQSSPAPQTQAAPKSEPDWLDQLLPDQPQRVGGGGGGSGPDLSRLRSITDQIRAQNFQGTALTKDEIERLKQYRDKMPTGSGGPDLTGLMALADAWGDDKSNFAGAYKRPETADERAAKKAAVELQLAGEGKKLADSELGALKDAQTGEIAAIHYGQIKSQANDAKQEAADQKGMQHFIDATNTAAKSGRFTAVGGAEKRIQAAQAVERIAQQYPNLDNMPPRVVHELAASFNNLVSNGNPNVTMYEDIVPKSARGKVSDIENYFLNRPGGAGQGAFVQNMLDSVGREKKLSQEQLNGFMKDISGGTANMDWAKRHPEEFKKIVRAQLNSARLTEPAMSGGSGFKAGDTGVKDGKTYRRDENGNWHEIGGQQ